MSGCEFCENYDTGDDYNPIIRADVNLGVCGNMDVDVVIVREGLYGPPALSLFGSLNTGDTTIERYFRIHYCPICGRELR